jgi:membrane fusion protein, multidrug efflux system
MNMNSATSEHDTSPAVNFLDEREDSAHRVDAEPSTARKAPQADSHGPNQPYRSNRGLARRLLITAVLLIAFVALAFSAMQLWNYVQSYESTDDAEVDGYISPISSRISGTITAVFVDDNQRVKAGQPLVQLDPRDYQVAVEQAGAQLAQAQADANSARQQYVAATAKIRQGQAQDYQAQRDLQRFSALLNQGVAPQAQYDQYHATALVDAANVNVARADAASALRTIASRQAQVDAARATLHQALLNLSYARILAPANGIIGKRTGQLGQRIDPGESLMALTQTDDLWVTANFKETQLARMGAGQAVTIHVDALGGDFGGHVQSMPGATGSLYGLLPPENATGNYVKVVQRLPVRIIFNGGQDLSRLRPGMSVEPTVWLK